MPGRPQKRASRFSLSLFICSGLLLGQPVVFGPMWSIDDILKPSQAPTPPRSPGVGVQSLPGNTPRRPVRCYPRFHPYSFEGRKRGETIWASAENVEPPSWLLTPPPATKDLAQSVLFPSPSSRPLGELVLNNSTILLNPEPSSPARRSRFATPLKAQELDDLCKPFLPKQTKNNNSWAQGVFKTWTAARNASPTVPVTDAVPVDILEVRYPVNVIDRTLAAFVFEARRADGNPYPGSTVKNILSALFRVMKQQQGASNVVNFVDRAERKKHFPLLHNSLDRVLRQLRHDGIGVERKRAALITPDIESKLWESGVIGCYSPQALLHAVFFYNGKNFCLRGISEHQNLRFSQIVRISTSPSRYTYMEFGSKNHSGGVGDRSEGKVVSIVGTDSPFRHVSILEKYLEKIPRDEITPDSSFYLTPLPFTPLGSRPWYFRDQYPRKKLQNMLKMMCQEAGVEGNFTNHSLRATGTTTLFDAGVPESIIQKRTGHRSLDALRTYERVTPSQELAVAKVLAPAMPATSAETPVASTSTPMMSRAFADEVFLDNLPVELFTSP